MKNTENVTRFFYFGNEIDQAMFEKFTLGEGFTLAASYKTDYPTDQPFATLVKGMEDVDESIKDSLAFCRTLEEWAKNYHGRYDGSESQLDIDPEDIKAFLASLPPEGKVG
ncbi:MAG: hypothetical protein JWM96_1039 [Alphaproteobacteria bacterium]|nr:hypothetical protein [Alphaproteobacteria bacterium]